MLDLILAFLLVLGGGIVVLAWAHSRLRYVGVKRRDDARAALAYSHTYTCHGQVSTGFNATLLLIPSAKARAACAVAQLEPMDMDVTADPWRLPFGDTGKLTAALAGALQVTSRVAQRSAGEPIEQALLDDARQTHHRIAYIVGDRL